MSGGEDIALQPGPADPRHTGRPSVLTTETHGAPPHYLAVNPADLAATPLLPRLGSPLLAGLAAVENCLIAVDITISCKEIMRNGSGVG